MRSSGAPPGVQQRVPPGENCSVFMIRQLSVVFILWPITVYIHNISFYIYICVCVYLFYSLSLYKQDYSVLSGSTHMQICVETSVAPPAGSWIINNTEAAAAAATHKQQLRKTSCGLKNSETSALNVQTVR